MKIIYHCYGGSHSSVTAAGIHLGLLPTGRVPTAEMLWGLPFFDQQVAKDHGNIKFMGVDEFNNQIYVLGRHNTAKLIENVLPGVAALFGIQGKELFMVDVMPYVNWRMMLGGYISRRLGWVRIGRPIVTRGTQYSFWSLTTLVQRVKMLAANS